VTNWTDNGSFEGQPPFASGGIDVETYEKPSTPYTTTVDNLTVSILATVANNDAYTDLANTALHINSPGVLANDSAGSGGALTALLAGGPSHGTLTLTNNGGFSYTPANNFVGTDSFTYKATDGQTTSSVAMVTLTVSSPFPPTASNNTYTVASGTVLNVPASGVLANDTGGNGPLTAVLVSGPAYGSLALTNNGGFTYTPSNNFTGVDTFTYEATDGQNTSAVATVTLLVTTPGGLFNDPFARPANNNSIFPWVNELGAWSITNGVFFGSCSLDNYGYAYYNANWTNYYVQAQFRYPTNNVWGGALGGRLNPATGARYDVWVYPENSPGGPGNGTATLQIIKYETWTGYTAQNLAQVSAVGTNWHTVKLAFQGSNVFAYFDGSQITNLADNGTFDSNPAFASGGIAVSLYASSPTYTMSVSNVIVAPLVPNQNYSTSENTPLTLAKPCLLYTSRCV